MPKRDDKLLLGDIQDAGNKILRFTQSVVFAAFVQNEEKVDAVIRNFEIIGEAAANLSPALQQKHTQIPWRRIIGYRNRLVHEYFGVDLQIVWKVVETELPQLLKNIHDLLNEI